MEIEKEDYDFLIDNCGVCWDRIYTEQIIPLVDKFNEIRKKYDKKD